MPGENRPEGKICPTTYYPIQSVIITLIIPLASEVSSPGFPIPTLSVLARIYQIHPPPRL
jgi:hypothetical protein